MKNDPDIAHMLAFKQGDQAAFRVLFDRYKKKIINYCYRFCQNAEVAQDLAQEVFIKVYRAAPNYKPDARFSTWLFKIATNVCLNELRRPYYRQKLESIDAPVAKEDGDMAHTIEDKTSLHPEKALESRQQEKLIQQALDSLPPKQKAALILCTFYDFSYEEIGKQIGKSESSVKSLIHRGRQNVKELLAKHI